MVLEAITVWTATSETPKDLVDKVCLYIHVFIAVNILLRDVLIC